LYFFKPLFLSTKVTKEAQGREASRFSYLSVFHLITEQMGTNPSKAGVFSNLTAFCAYFILFFIF
jgi:hypothetical protein